MKTRESTSPPIRIMTILAVGAASGHRWRNLIHFEINGPGEIVATDNGDPTDMALVIVRAKRGQSGPIMVIARSDGLAEGRTTVMARAGSRQ